jgi:hypothetical protein
MMSKVRWQIVDEDGERIVKEIHKVVVHKFRMGDVEDPDLYAAQPIYDWQQTDQGKFIMEHAIDQPEWHRRLDHSHYGHEYTIVAELEMKKLSEYYLRWGKPNGI